ncbi:MAG TPA: DUF2059 domain-containing protein [Bryobacteraceae bacterium]|jgi:hypothetical protein|nr:DUF2059 domain-containing protein [Bryobacteraceae bacterium]
MKPLLVFALALLVLVADASAQELTKQAKIERLLDAMNADATINQLFDQIKAMTAAQMPPGATPEQTAKAREVQDKILDLVKSRISWEKMRPSYIKLYSETFSDEEVSGILAFYQSPPGRAMLAKMPALLTKLIEVAQAQMAELQPDIQRILREAQQR